MKIGFFGLEEQEKIDFYKEELKDFELEFFAGCLNPAALPEKKDFDAISIFVGCKVDTETIDSFPNLKLIAVRSTGFDNVDIEYAKQKNITVCNVPAYGSHTVAEFTFGLILNLSRKFPQAISRIRENKTFDYSNLRGFDLVGKTLGVIGTGKIGLNVIKIANGFGMKVLAYDKYPNQKAATDLNFSYIGFDQLLEESDIISLHAPASPETEHLINSNNIFKIKKGAYLINTARGKLIETDVLYQAIIQKHLSGAALDVLEEENLFKSDTAEIVNSQQAKEDLKLMELENVIITPHMAFYTKEAEENIMHTTVENILNFNSGKITNKVN